MVATNTGLAASKGLTSASTLRRAMRPGFSALIPEGALPNTSARNCTAGASTLQVLSVDPDGKTVDLLGSELGYGSNYFARGVLANNGQIYFAPFDASCVLCVDA
mmetsp:Transcript_90500/g.251562  ORF Transcript_90500/g.251562 Transcript_90500/m.251562 type:complete len:105 (+) Transcript_90500:456-770(+)